MRSNNYRFAPFSSGQILPSMHLRDHANVYQHQNNARVFTAHAEIRKKEKWSTEARWLLLVAIFQCIGGV